MRACHALKGDCTSARARWNARLSLLLLCGAGGGSGSGDGGGGGQQQAVQGVSRLLEELCGLLYQLFRRIGVVEQQRDVVWYQLVGIVYCRPKFDDDDDDDDDDDGGGGGGDGGGGGAAAEQA